MILPCITTHYSLLKGFIKPDEAAEQCKRLGYTHCILADDNLSGAIDFFLEMKEAGIVPIIGLRKNDQLYIAKTHRGYRDLLKIASNIEVLSHPEDLEICDESELAAFSVYYSKPEDAILHRICLCSHYKTKLSQINEVDLGQDKVFFNTEEFHFKDVSMKLFTEEQLGRSKNIIGGLEEYTLLAKPKLPKVIKEGMGEDEYLIQLCRDGYRAKFKHLTGDKKKEYGDRVKYELDIITKFGLSGYFLIVYDIMDFIGKNGWFKAVGRGCFLPDTLVKMSDGMYSPIAMIKSGFEVLDAFGDKQTVINTFEYDIDEEIVILEFENGKIIRCTKDHEFLTTNRGWVRADSLNEADDIVEI